MSFISRSCVICSCRCTSQRITVFTLPYLIGDVHTMLYPGSFLAVYGSVYFALSSMPFAHASETKSGKALDLQLHRHSNYDTRKAELTSLLLMNLAPSPLLPLFKQLILIPLTLLCSSSSLHLQDFKVLKTNSFRPAQPIFFESLPLTLTQSCNPSPFSQFCSSP